MTVFRKWQKRIDKDPIKYGLLVWVLLAVLAVLAVTGVIALVALWP